MSIRALYLTVCLSIAVVLSVPADKKCSPVQVEMFQTGRGVAENMKETVINIDQIISVDQQED